MSTSRITCMVCEREDHEAVLQALLDSGICIWYCGDCLQAGAEPIWLVESEVKQRGGWNKVSDRKIRRYTVFKDGRYQPVTVLRPAIPYENPPEKTALLGKLYERVRSKFQRAR